MSTSIRIRRTASAAMILALAGLAAGCTSDGPSAPVDYSGGHYTERALPPAAYTVQRGDTIYGIARQFNLSVRAVIDANNLQPPYQLAPGQVLSLSTGADYQVVRGDTLLGIARRIGVPFDTLARMNGLQAPYVVKLGQHLKLPSSAQTETAMAPPPLAPAEVPKIAQAPLPPPMVAVRKDGYAPLAEREKAANDQDRSAAVLPPPPPPPSAPPIPAAAPIAEQPKMAAVTTTAPPAPPAAVAAPPPRSGRGFIWPVKGDVISEFGTAGHGVHNDGINIAVARGTPVHAADDGVVAYSGNELRGFGNLLLIKHSDGWMTAYAHNDQLLVKRGDTVKRGQKIALAGDSGGVSQPQVHFEVRQGTRAVDPATFFKDRPGPTVAPADPTDPG